LCDANRQQLAHVYYESEPGRRSAAKLLTKDEARRIAANIAGVIAQISGIEARLGCNVASRQHRFRNRKNSQIK
jgi:hypothetical protein